MTPRPHYDTLGVKPDATQDEIKRVFRARAKKCHPDHHPGDKEKEAEFKRLSAAYAVLSDPDARRHYDETGEAPAGEQNILGEACGLIVQTFQRLRDVAGDNIFYDDPIETMKGFLSETMDEAKSHIEKLRKKIKRNEKLTGKISHKAGSQSFLHAALADEDRRNEKQIKSIGYQVDVLKKAREVLDEYSFAAEKREVNVRDRRGRFPFGFMGEDGFEFKIDPSFNPYSKFHQYGGTRGTKG